jgi:hypothetical protein
LKEQGGKGTRAIVVGQSEYRSCRREGESIDRIEVESMIGFNGVVIFVNHDKAADL